ncbi:MAG: MBL fold metallo-hydrolase [Armatimonadetes bacterium]|nr:MBL fold metallo-hydrolase [Armatimonadota bacterium]
MKITLLVDNEAASDMLKSEHGLSFLVETNDGAVMFDTGQTDAWLYNLIALGREPGAIKAIGLSHGHYDHTGGLIRAMKELPRIAYFAHPACFQPKYAQSTVGVRYIGMPAEVVLRKAAFVLNKSAVEVLPGVILSGEITPMVGTQIFESRFLTGDDELTQDTFEDEQCLIVRNGGKVAVLVGCAHRGVENNVLAAINVAGVTRIDLLAGGFHLGGADEDRLESLAGFLQRMDIGQIACCHCTGAKAYQYLRSNLGSRVTAGRAGMSWCI